MSNHTCRVIEIIGTSPDRIDTAIRNDLGPSGRDHTRTRLIEVQSVSGHLANQAVAHVQIAINVGFRSEDA
jgi:flavin-binding protein dodecin